MRKDMCNAICADTRAFGLSKPTVHFLYCDVYFMVHLRYSMANGQQGYSAVQPVPQYLHSLLTATSLFSVFIGQTMQLTG